MSYSPSLQYMDDDHLIASVRATLNPLTTTPIEEELLRRFEAKVDKTFEQDALVSACIRYDYSIADAAEMIAVLADEMIQDAKHLQERFGRFGKSPRKTKEKK